MPFDEFWIWLKENFKKSKKMLTKTGKSYIAQFGDNKLIFEVSTGKIRQETKNVAEKLFKLYTSARVVQRKEYTISYNSSYMLPLMKKYFEQ